MPVEGFLLLIGFFLAIAGTIGAQLRAPMEEVFKEEAEWLTTPTVVLEEK